MTQQNDRLEKSERVRKHLIEQGHDPDHVLVSPVLTEIIADLIEERDNDGGAWCLNPDPNCPCGFPKRAAATEPTCGHDSIAADCPICAVYARAAATEDTSLGNTFDADEAYDFGGRAAATVTDK